MPRLTPSRLLRMLLAGAAFAAPVVCAAAGPGPGVLARTPAELLAWMDADADGRVALVEYQHYLTRGFRALDRNGDGIVDGDELPPGVSSRGRRPSVDLTGRERALADSFHRQDVDADGFLDSVELAAPPQ